MMPRLIIALAIVGAGLSLALLSLGGADSQSEPDTDIELRINAKRLADGRTEFALQRRDDGEWSDRIQPRGRYLPASPPVDRWLNSTAVSLGTSASPEHDSPDLPTKPSRWQPFHSDSTTEFRGTRATWSVRVGPLAEWTAIGKAAVPTHFETGGLMGIWLHCHRDDVRPTWQLVLPETLDEEGTEITVEFVTSDSRTYSQSFRIDRSIQGDNLWTMREKAATFLTLITAPDRHDESRDDLTIRLLGSNQVLAYDFDYSRLHRLATSSRSPDPLDNVLYCGQYGDDAEDADDSF